MLCSNTYENNLRIGKTNSSIQSLLAFNLEIVGASWVDVGAFLGAKRSVKEQNRKKWYDCYLFIIKLAWKLLSTVKIQQVTAPE